MRAVPDGRRVVVTGMGAVSSLGVGVAALWDGLLEGRSGVSRIRRFNPEGLAVRIAAEAAEVPADNRTAALQGFSGARLRWLLAALHEAIQDASLQPRQAPAGVSIAGGELNVDHTPLLAALDDAVVDGALDAARLQHALAERDGATLPLAFHPLAAALVASTIGARGPVLAPSGACASGTMAIGLAAESIAWGDVDVCVAGGTDARVEPMVMEQYARLGALCVDSNDAPEKASRPFDASRAGFVMGEGAAVFVLESLEHALVRGAHIRGEVAGYGSALDAYRATDPEPDGRGASLAITAALANAGCEPLDLDYVNAHGTSTRANDAAEATALRRALGPRAASIPVGSFKANLGHAIQASGALETVGTLLALEQGVLPHTVNTRHIEPDIELDIVMGAPRHGSFRTALKNSFGFGGQNACLVLRRWG